MLQSLGAQRVDQGAYEAGEATLAEALAEARRAGDREIEALSLAHLGAASWGRGNRVEAIARLEDALALGQATGHPVPIEVAARYLGLIAAEAGHHAAAAGWYRKTMTDDTGMDAPVRLVLDVASLAMARGDAELSTQLFGAASTLAGTIGFAPSWPERGAHERAREQARSELGSAFDAAFDIGSRLSPERILADVTAVLDASSGSTVPEPSAPTPPAAAAQ